MNLAAWLADGCGVETLREKPSVGVFGGVAWPVSASSREAMLVMMMMAASMDGSMEDEAGGGEEG
ncbi:hypothetical protein N7536_002533 [Penicillium majusculum]|nr:hypothetical protein N7536_002533 [Penicillium majusculum]